jgi:hypothetical protein
MCGLTLKVVAGRTRVPKQFSPNPTDPRQLYGNKLETLTKHPQTDLAEASAQTRGVFASYPHCAGTVR